MEDRKYLFQKLTPVSNADISVYEEAINFVFENSDVKNVAISGAYSAGKSSILESYKVKHKNYKFVHLSLAHFRTSEQENTESDEPVKESVLEGKILNQLIHQIPSEKIPQTNFRVKKGVSKKNLVGLTAFVSLFILSIVFLLSLTTTTSFIADLPDNWIKGVLSILFNSYAAIIVSLILIVCSVTFIFNLIKAQKNKNVFRKISLQGNEIEIFEEQEDSYFDKYLNEVLYLFENVEADVIVFEDMDRFNASRIFERLREVNTLVNIQRKKEDGDKYVPLRFFYLLRDDIFVSKDRTKFFDYIIPIVPVVDSSNSYEQFLKHLKEGNLLGRFDQAFLQSLSLYVDDMRILKNIYNEFVVYIHRLNTTDLDCNKMLAMVAYKNLFPRDFSDLQLARGFVYTLFAQKPRLVDEVLISAKKQKQDILDRIEWVKKEVLTSQKELDDVYAAKNDRLPTDYYGRLSKEGQELKKQYDMELPKRKQAIQDVLESNLPKLEAELADIERDISLIRTKSLKALITRENIDSVFSVSHTNEIGEVNEFKEIKGSEYFNLLKFLVRNGYVDETYADYMTYFYDDSISANDKTFLRRITDRRGAEYTYTIKEPKKIIESPVIRAVEFEQEETLNFDLLECLLLNDSTQKYSIYLKTLLAQIRKTRNFDFISKFYATGKAHEKFVIRINELWSNFFSLALEGNTIPSAQIRQFSIETCYFSDEEIIKSINVDNCLAEYISNSPDYLAIDRPNISKLVSGFSLIGVSFAMIGYDESDKNLFDEVYRQCLYALTFENISLMLKKKYGVESDSDITHKNYTLVQSQLDSPLAEYVSENISVYTEIILVHCNGNISDDEDIAIRLLNNANVEDTVKKRYIELLSTNIVDITQVTEPKLWTAMISQQVVPFSVTNFANYFLKHGLDEILIGYINHEQSEVDFTAIAEDFGEDAAEKIFDAVAICNALDASKYRKILIDLRYYFNNFDAAEINEEKFKILIADGILQMDADSLGFVRDKYSRYQLTFIKRNLDEYLALQDEALFKLDEALHIITWDIDDKKKIGLLDFNSEPLSIIGKQYSDTVNAYIISNAFETNDKQALYMNYSQYGEQAQTAIAEMAATVAGVKEIIAQKMEIDDALLSVLLQNDTVTRDQKINLFTMSIPRLNEDTCKAHFSELGLSDLNGIFTKSSGRRNYEKSKEITTILDALKSYDWIYDYHDDERNSERYIIIKNKPQREPEILD